MDIVRFIVASFAVYRLSRMLALEKGPFEIFEEWRGQVARRFGTLSWVTEGFACPLCLSFWIGLVFALVWTWALSLWWVEGVLLWLGLSGAATFLYKMEGR